MSLGLLRPRKDRLYWQYHQDYYEEAFMSISSRKGQGLVEYALLILLIGLAVLVALALFGSGVGNMFSNIIANV